MNKDFYVKTIFSALLLVAFLTAPSVKAANIGDIVSFNVDKNFDINGKTQVPATLMKIGSKAYFYVEKNWWDAQSQTSQLQLSASLNNLSDEFDNHIYPKLTSVFGAEWNPGIDNDTKITILFEPINSTEGGYFREDDEYDKLQLPDSNQREIVYLSATHIDKSDAKIILAHEFTHLITFNQKNKINKVEEDTWLNEARAIYSSTILGYDDDFSGSNLQQRMNDFIENPTDSVTDWNSGKYDYASADLFISYLVDHYGVNVLADSLKLKDVGIKSIDGALSMRGFRENFSQVFANWTIALVLNDCSQNPNYCYLNKNLASLRVGPALIFLPLSGNSSLSSTNVTKNWAGNWQKIIGGNGNVKLIFSSLPSNNFKVPYVLYDKSGAYYVNYLQIGNDEKGEIQISDFGAKYKSLIIIPSLQSKNSGFDSPDSLSPYTFTVSILGSVPQSTGDSTQTNDQETIKKLLAQIDVLKKQISDLTAKKTQPINIQGTSCLIDRDLYWGMSGSQVSCLQQFLRNQGRDIYPGGYITGNFNDMTKTAVIKFQEKYRADILMPFKVSYGTGYVGTVTRNKINQILSGK